MAFNYDLASADADVALVSKVRLELGDINENAGVRPDGTNLSDEEILHWLGEESSNVMLAAARACDALARAWSIVGDETIGPRKYSLGAVAGKWEKLAASLRSGNQSAPVVYIS